MIDIQERLTAFAMLGATWVMWLLVLLSIIGVAIIFERVYYFFASRDDVRKLQEDLRLLLAKNDIAGARERLSQSESFQAKIVYSGIEVVDDGSETVEERLAGATSVARTQMERSLGFLGTVVGMIIAFQSIELAGEVEATLVAGGIKVALLTTAAGLAIAIPVSIAHNYFVSRIDAMVIDMEESAQKMVDTLLAIETGRAG